MNKKDINLGSDHLKEAESSFKSVFHFLWPCHWLIYSAYSPLRRPTSSVQAFYFHYKSTTRTRLPPNKNPPWLSPLARRHLSQAPNRPPGLLHITCLIMRADPQNIPSLGVLKNPPWAWCHRTFSHRCIFVASESGSCLQQAFWNTSSGGERGLCRWRTAVNCIDKGAEGNHLGCWGSVWGLIDWLRDPGAIEGHKHTRTHTHADVFATPAAEVNGCKRLDLNNDPHLLLLFRELQHLFRPCWL